MGIENCAYARIQRRGVGKTLKTGEACEHCRSAPVKNRASGSEPGFSRASTGEFGRVRTITNDTCPLHVVGI